MLRAEVGSAIAVEDGRLRLRSWHLGLATVLLACLLDLAWNVRFGVASPARVVLYAAIAACIGNLLSKLASGAASRTFSEAFFTGQVAISFLCFGVRGFGWPSDLLLASLLALAAVGVRFGDWRLLLNRSMSPWSLLPWSLALAIVARAEWVMELPQLTQRHPTVFSWIDTPLWLNLAYGLERGFPAHELLFKGGLLNYHYGAGVLPLSIRDTTGMPMHIALVATIVLCGLLTALLLPTLITRYCKVHRDASRVLAWVLPVAGALWFQRYVGNYPNVVGTALMLYALLELQRARRWRSLLITYPTFLLLMLTKEVCYVACLVTAGCLASWAYYRQRDWRGFARLAILFVGTRLLYNPLVHMDQKVTVELFREHVNFEWVTGVLGYRSLVPLAITIVLAGFLLWRRHLHTGAVLVASAVTYVTLAALSIAARPRLHPPSDPVTEEWILIDMGQFETLGFQIMMLATFGVLLAEWARTRWALRYPLLSAVVISAGVLVYSHDKYSRTPPPTPDHMFEEYRGPNAIVPVLAQIDPYTSVIASSRLNWNQENPHWAAFFGHQFYASRHGRWATAYPHYQSQLQKQHTIFSAPRSEDVAALVRAEGITHVLVDKQAPTPWSGSVRPVIETERYAVYQF